MHRLLVLLSLLQLHHGCQVFGFISSIGGRRSISTSYINADKLNDDNISTSSPKSSWASWYENALLDSTSNDVIETSPTNSKQGTIDANDQLDLLEEQYNEEMNKQTDVFELQDK